MTVRMILVFWVGWGPDNAERDLEDGGRDVSVSFYPSSSEKHDFSDEFLMEHTYVAFGTDVAE